MNLPAKEKMYKREIIKEGYLVGISQASVLSRFLFGREVPEGPYAWAGRGGEWPLTCLLQVSGVPGGQGFLEFVRCKKVGPCTVVAGFLHH